LNFRAPDPARYPALALAREVMETGGLAGAAFNAAKEVALDGFIASQIGFLDMSKVVESVLNRLMQQNSLSRDTVSLENVVAMNHLARNMAQEDVVRRAN